MPKSKAQSLVSLSKVASALLDKYWYIGKDGKPHCRYCPATLSAPQEQWQHQAGCATLAAWDVLKEAKKE